jgi:hypothetical protein
MVLNPALDYLRSGFSLIPITDGQKNPALPSWDKYQQEKPTEETLRTWFPDNNRNVALVMGAVSGNCTALDIEKESAAEDLLSLLRDKGHHGLLEKLGTTYCVRTPRGGRHYYFKSVTTYPSLKLAYDTPTMEDGKPKAKILIETRGEGGYVLAPPSQISGHGPYTVIHGNPGDICFLTLEEMDLLFDCCKSLNRDESKSPSPKVNRSKRFQRIDDDLMEGEINGDDSGDDFNSEDYPYLQRVLDNLDGLKIGNNGWNACCPSPWHGKDGVDRSPSLRITIRDKGKIVFYCRTGCTKKDVAYGLGLKIGDLSPRPGEKVPPNLIEIDNPSMDEDEELFASFIYQKLFDRLTLSPLAIKHLKARGLSDKDIEELDYKSYHPEKDCNVIKDLDKEFGKDLYKVPGFIKNKEGKPSLNVFQEGILIPIRFSQGNIHGIKVRWLNSWSSMRYMLLTTKGGSYFRDLFHFPKGFHDQLELIRITEGELKADLATLFSGLYTIGCPGVFTLSAPLEFLTKQCPSAKIILSPDFGEINNNGIAEKVLQDIYDYQQAGFKVYLEAWLTNENGMPKGIDDALKAGAELSHIPGDEAVKFLEEILSDVGMAESNNNEFGE